MSDQHYLRRIVALGEHCPVVTQRPITSERGIKLVDSGVRISDALYDKLARHKLLPELDECLTVDNAVTPESIVGGVRDLLVAGDFGRLLGDAVDVGPLLAVFAALPLDPVLAFKLTVAREEAPAIYRHSLEVAVCAVVLVMQRTGADQVTCGEAAAAGLFHDLGLLHIDPLLLDGEHVLNEAESHHIYSHPVIGHVMLSRFPEWHPVVSSAVLEHHERLDASGYPRGLEENELSPLGQVLAVAELAAALFSQAHLLPLADYLNIVLALNKGKLNPEIAAQLTQLALQYPGAALPGGADPLYAAVLGELVVISTSIQSWHAMLPHFGAQPMVDLISLRLERLEHNLADVGIDLQFWAMVDAALPDDPAALRELQAGAREGRWQLRAIAHEVHRKWAVLEPASSAIKTEILAWLERIEQGAAG